VAKGGGKTIIIKKIKKGGHGHHGGSWKVAYADFVTAMMAFFMVMWILGMDENTKKAIEGYFSNPIGFKKGYSSGSSPLAAGSSPAAVQRQAMQVALRNLEQRRFEEVKRLLSGKMDSISGGGITTSNIEISISSDGLRIEMLENSRGNTFFELGSAAMKTVGQSALAIIAEQLVTLDNPLVIEGHTDARPYGREDYTNWELSSDRANAARRVLERSGVPAVRIVEVNGLADKQLKYPGDPQNPSNRRISLLLPFTTMPEPRSLEALRNQIGGAATDASADSARKDATRN
jgi:chemotaxis protein MotB